MDLLIQIDVIFPDNFDLKMVIQFRPMHADLYTGKLIVPKFCLLT